MGTIQKTLSCLWPWHSWASPLPQCRRDNSTGLSRAAEDRSQAHDIADLRDKNNAVLVTAELLWHRSRGDQGGSQGVDALSSPAPCRSCCKGPWRWPFISGFSFLLSGFPRLEDNMLPPVGDCNIHRKVKLFSVRGCSLWALVSNHSLCVNTGYGNLLIPGCHGSGVIFPPGRAPGSPPFLYCPPIFAGCTLEKGISTALWDVLR